MIGYEDTAPAHWAHIDLTSVGQNAADHPVSAIDAVVARLDDAPDAPVNRVFEPRIVVRGTTGPPPGR